MLHSIYDVLHDSNVTLLESCQYEYRLVMIFKYSGEKTKEEMLLYVKRMQLIFWGIFAFYLAFWFFIWRMCVTHEAM